MSEEATQQENKLLTLIQKAHPGFHPILVLAEIASGTGDENVRANAAKGMLPYIEPQLKSIEVRGHMKNDFGVLRVSMVDEEDGE